MIKTFTLLLSLLSIHISLVLGNGDLIPAEFQDPIRVEISIKVFPNPSTSGEFALEFAELTKSDKTDIIIYNLIGKKVYQKQILDKEGPHQEFLHLGHMAKGIYMLQVIQGEKKVTRRLSFI